MKPWLGLVAVAACGNTVPGQDAAVRPWSVRCVPRGTYAADRHPTFDASAASVRGDLEASKIADTIEAAAPQLAACGTDVAVFTVTWFIDPGGRALEPVAKPSSPLAKCATDVIGTLRFPPPKGGGGALVGWTFAYHPPPAISLAERARDEAAKVQQQLEQQLPALTQCLAPTPEATIAFDGEGTHVVVEIPNAAACASRSIAIVHPVVPVSCTVGAR